MYWVNAEQVSKTPPTGMYIATGSFIIRGKRNFIQPRSLTLGLTLMFNLNEESLANHIGERKIRLEDEDRIRLEQEKAAELERYLEKAALQEKGLIDGSEVDLSDVQIV